VTDPISIDPAAYAEKLAARVQVQLTRQAEEITRLLVEIAQLETYSADLASQLAKQASPDPWGDEKGHEQ
jgi:hypothetical protein